MSTVHVTNSLASSLSLLPELQRQKILNELTEEKAAALLYDWQFWARSNQVQPEGDWTYWLLLAGRGFGKTRTGAETVRAWVEDGYMLGHLVAPTAGDARDVMIQGESGLLNCFPPGKRPLYEPSKRLITFHTGAICRVFSADEPERLRGPQCQFFWADELCSWRFAQEAWDNLEFGFRLGDRIRGVITTTPKPTKTLKELIKDPATVITRGSSHDNRPNLAPKWFKSVISKKEGTRLGRQEIYAEVLEDTPGALWTVKLIEATRLKYSEIRWDRIIRVVIAVDPAVTAADDSDETGIIVLALTMSHHILVMEDLTCKESPLGWAKIVKAAYVSKGADRVIAEVNNGGDLVEANIRMVAPNIPFRAVRATRGKYVRAEPAAALYEQGRVHHVGNFPQLEEQMCSWIPGSKEKSPDRMDALVWGCYELLIQQEEIEGTVMRDIEEISSI